MYINTRCDANLKDSIIEAHKQIVLRNEMMVFRYFIFHCYLTDIMSNIVIIYVIQRMIIYLMTALYKYIHYCPK